MITFAVYTLQLGTTYYSVMMPLKITPVLKYEFPGDETDHFTLIPNKANS